MMDILEAIQGRSSVRAYLKKPVEKKLIEAVLEAARFAPSGKNTQPWKVAVVQGDVKTRLSETLLQAHRSGEPKKPDYAYYPEKIFPPYDERPFRCGMAMYQALGIERGDKEKRMAQWEANYQFFGAPVGLFFFIHSALEKGSWVDMGMFIQNVMLAARGVGLETCPQASLAEYPDIVRAQLGIEPVWQVVCGMCVGYKDPDHPVNNYRTEREELESFTTWY